MGSGLAAVAGDGLAIHAEDPADLADAVALGDVLEDRDGLHQMEVGAEKRGALTLGGSGLAGAAAEHTSGLGGPVAMRDGEISGPRLPYSGQSEFSQQNRESSSMVPAQRGYRPRGQPVARSDLFMP